MNISQNPLLNAETVPAYIDWETWFAEEVYGQKLNQDGSILFRPLTDGIDMTERNTGKLLYRIQVPVNVADVYDSLVLTEDTNGNTTAAVITADGVTLVDLSTLPIPTQGTKPFLKQESSAEGNLSGVRTDLPEARSLSSPPQFLSSRPRLKHASRPTPAHFSKQ